MQISMTNLRTVTGQIMARACSSTLTDTATEART